MFVFNLEGYKMVLIKYLLVMRYSLQIMTVSAILLILHRYFPQKEDFTILQVSSFDKVTLVTKLLLLQGILNGVCALAEYMCVSNMPLGKYYKSISSLCNYLIPPNTPPH